MVALMPDTIRERALARVEAILAAGAATLPAPIPALHRNPDSEIQERPALALFDGTETSDDSTWGIDIRVMDFEIEGHVTADAGGANALAGRVQAWLAADPTLNGLATECRVTEQRFSYTEGRGKKTVTGFSLGVTATTWCKPGDPFTLAP
jgi:hypothetical protein